ncbi:MAG: hypothetical protein BWK76_15270 [Desulfobulbaceae bacterium A2]|nr:MAG: hypothetical protein BWK76_15270 [Desulfobulbaceae bacterium A2]
MKTFTRPREFVENPRYAQERREAMTALDPASINEPLADIIAGFAALPHCFTLQSCYGHFLWLPGQDAHSLESVPPDHAGPVRYRIAYIAFCLEHSTCGQALRDALADIPAVAPDFIQFGSADWFWERWLNSYTLQVEPAGQQHLDEAILNPAEALRCQEVRQLFCQRLRTMLAVETSKLLQ